LKKVILSERELVSVIKKVMSEIEKNSSGEEKILEFAKKIHVFENTYLNKEFDLKTQREYVNRLITKKENIIKEYNERFEGRLITESKKGSDYINNFFDFLIKNANYSKKEIVLSETWERTPPGKSKDPIGYWKILFENLTKSGIGVKWQVANDPAKSSFMYWGGWVINKDLKKNGGFPITWTDAATKTNYYFKFDLPGAKYAGNAIDKTLLALKNVTGKNFNLLNVGKTNEKTLKPFFSKNYSSESIGKEEEKTANTVYSLLTKSFDQDSDGIWNDYDGTDENGAVAAMNKITSRGILDKVNAKIKAKGYYKDITSWVEAEMSDIDPTQLDAIRNRLSKLGYRVPEKNNALRVVGKTKEAVGAIWDWAKNGVIGKFFNALRDALNSAWGIAVQLFLDALGPETLGAGFAVPMVVWGIVVQWDMFNMYAGTPEWLNLIFDAFSLLTAGAMVAALKPIKAAASTALKGAKGTLGNIVKWLLGKVPVLMEVLAKWFPTLASAVGKIGGFIAKAATWIGTKFRKFIGAKMADGLINAGKGAANWIKELLESIGKWIKTKVGAQVTKDVAKEGAKTLAQKIFQQSLIYMKKQTGWKWLYSKWIDKGLRKGAPELIETFIIKNAKTKTTEEACAMVDKQIGQIEGDFCRFVPMIQSTAEQRRKLMASMKKTDVNDINKMIKGLKGTSKAIKKGSAETNKVVSQVGTIYNDTDLVRKDSNYQYKRTPNGYEYASLTENPPVWKKIKDPEAIKNLNNTLYKNLKVNTTSGFLSNIDIEKNVSQITQNLRNVRTGL
jgi:hypothetical protein